MGSWATETPNSIDEGIFYYYFLLYEWGIQGEDILKESNIYKIKWKGLKKKKNEV